MKKIKFFIFFLFISQLLQAKEINLYCKGLLGFYSSYRGLEEKLDAKIEVKFDDATNKILYVDPTRLFGCYPGKNEKDYKRTCDCNINESLILCKAVSSNDKGYRTEQSVNINRFTGILSYNEITIGLGDSGKHYIFSSGDLSCNKYDEKKF